ncbi:probable tRNA(His) guanylyltransferase [Corticium candelabrum]|uniref:probable tRNA(His) guanylyltransferase n=1 Tax=Corticium candelabrum TaxID=121492 RepID=UPI002E26E420|nr:probable tRNA(His) guanylyltransferase [Corticium candelabrum]
MAKSRFEYVKQFEQDDKLLLGTWIVIRIDGRNFHRFSDEHGFLKPNDERALQLMNKCAECVMYEFGEIVLAYGQSDEYSFVLRPRTTLFKRRASKLLSTIVSYFASSYVYQWRGFFGEKPMIYPPMFDGRVILYPTLNTLRDYLSWRQADCHINNLYNTCFWCLVKSGQMTDAAESRLSGTSSSDKNEILFTEFSINYNDLPAIFRKGSTLIWHEVDETITKQCRTKDDETITERPVLRTRKSILTLHVDVIGDEFWAEHADIMDE